MFAFSLLGDNTIKNRSSNAGQTSVSQIKRLYLNELLPGMYSDHIEEVVKL